jgi:hypothetical protein
MKQIIDFTERPDQPERYEISLVKNHPHGGVRIEIRDLDDPDYQYTSPRLEEGDEWQLHTFRTICSAFRPSLDGHALNQIIV